MERIVYANSESGFMVIKVKEGRKKDLTTAVGKLLGVEVGQSLRARGIWRHKPQYGWSFEIEHFETKPPENKEAIVKYLQSGSIKGIGEVYASKIVEVFGERTLEVLENNPQRLAEVPGIGKKRQEAIVTSWQAQSNLRELLLFLQPYDVSTSLAQKIYKTYGLDARQRIEANPYDLSRDIYGIGFKRADQIASKIGLSGNHPKRLQAALCHILEEAIAEGHTCLPMDELLKRASELCIAEVNNLENELQTLVKESYLHAHELTYEGARQMRVWQKSLYGAERSIASNFYRIKESGSLLRHFDVLKAVEWAQKKMGLELSKSQFQAIESVCHKKVMILTGGPGTGKSTITRILVAIYSQLTKKILLAAPTGRAAKRLGELNKQTASTLHQLLEFSPSMGNFKRDRSNPLDADLIIVDEASMLDTFLLHSLLKAIPDSCKLLLVGDIDQLPSVGAGNVLRDIIDSGCIHVEKLQEIHRQAKESKIVTSAHEINRGLAPVYTPNAEDDFFFLRLESPEKIMATILSLVCERVPQKYGFDPIHDIQVLSPMKKGPLGIENLNHQLQEVLQTGKKSINIGYSRYFIGDKLMQIRNNYQKEVFNGDILFVTRIDEEARLLWANTQDEREIEYSFNELDELQHAYAVSVHKYQGSECPCIIMPLHKSHAILLQRNLLYTAVTRGKKLVILIGSPETMQQAVIKASSLNRYSGLLMFLIERFGSWGGLFQAPYYDDRS